MQVARAELQPGFSQLVSYISKLPEYHFAVDGMALAGKGTLGQGIEELLQWVVFNTGDFFRAVTYFFLTTNIIETLSTATEPEFSQMLAELQIQLLGVGLHKQVLITAGSQQLRESSYVLRSPAVDAHVSSVAGNMAVRRYVEQQTHHAFMQVTHGMIEARDSYDVSPHVDSAFYLWAREEVLIQRAIARWAATRGEELDNEVQQTITAQVKNRNKADQSRPLGMGKLLSPQKALENDYYRAVIDTSDRTPSDVLAIVISFIAFDQALEKNHAVRYFLARLLLRNLGMDPYQRRGVTKQGRVI